MRQSPVLHSRIVRAYLDPNASSAHQHASPEFVREAWLQEHQETQRESSEEEEEEDSAQDSLAEQRVPSLTHLQSYHHQAPVLVTAPGKPGVLCSTLYSFQVYEMATMQSNKQIYPTWQNL